MKILSIILYNDEAVIAMIAGMAYVFNNFPTGSMPRTVGETLELLFIFFVIYHGYLEYERGKRRDGVSAAIGSIAHLRPEESHDFAVFGNPVQRFSETLDNGTSVQRYLLDFRIKPYLGRSIVIFLGTVQAVFYRRILYIGVEHVPVQQFSYIPYIYVRARRLVLLCFGSLLLPRYAY